MITSSSKWTTKDSLDQLAITQLPELKDLPPFLKDVLTSLPTYAVKSVDDFSPNFGQDGAGILNIIPFSELNNIIRDGDVVVFMEPKLELTDEKFMKQRGWHAEIAFRNPDGIAVQCAPYGNGETEIRECQCTELSTHSEFQNASRNNLHVFRIAESSGEDGQIRGLLKGVRLWRQVYHHYRFPRVDNGKWVFDCADFGTVAELENIAKQIILSPNDVPEMYCMQWVHAVLSLALNVPLNRPTLTRLGVLEPYEKKWTELGFIDEHIKPLGRLPIIPYAPEDHVIALCRLYLGMSDDDVRGALTTFLPQEMVPSFLRLAPSRSVPPIVTLSEYRKSAHTGTVTWEYVATTFPDDRCVLK